MRGRLIFFLLPLVFSNLRAQETTPPRPAAQPAAPPAAQQKPAETPPARKPKPRPAATGLATYINPDALFEVDTYSKAAVVPNTGKTVYFSGSIPLDKAFNIVGKDDLRAQTKQCLKNLEIVMKAANVTKNDIVKLGVNIVYKGNTDSFIVAEELQNFFERDEMPATTMAGAPFLIANGVLVQIEAMAVIKE
ncbi:MAG TPA: RidA family protein [Bryobacteraceae bacterium]